MSYQTYVITAYAVFVAVMLWEWIAPTLQIKRQLRSAKRRALPNARRGPTAPDRHPGERRNPS